MIGFSLYFEEKIDFKKIIDNNKDFDLVFTSLHYPASDESYKEFLKLYELCSANNIRICVDINNETLKTYPKLLEMGLILRLDFGFSFEEIAKLSKKTDLAINASTVTLGFLNELKKSNVNLEKITAIHNYYPLEYSGLAEDFFVSQNKMIKDFGMKVGAFVPGNGQLRGPVYKGLPTLEEDRYKNPYQVFVNLQRKFDLDLILLAEDTLNADKEYIIKFAKQNILTLPATFKDEYKNLDGIKVRPDISDYLIRNERDKKEITPSNPQMIKRGDVVILNDLSGRYAGEIEIIKKDLNISQERNIIGRIDKNYENIIDYIRGGDKIEFYRR
ncbi:MupG family TIM beta-alpha barrel fold protein [Anaerococcus cruorum]|uniref:MupG family TIM beta-alpha barrel fold protein n=1 Tax=Anaerococcus sp. WGS1596 TaxID=3366806 RepID=UPI00372D4167